MFEPFIYLFVREDLSKPQQIIQAAHAVDAMNKKFVHDEQNNHIALVGVESEESLFECRDLLQTSGIGHAIFKEPDLGNEWTAIATEPLRGVRRKPLKRFQLMK